MGILAQKRRAKIVYNLVSGIFTRPIKHCNQNTCCNTESPIVLLTLTLSPHGIEKTDEFLELSNHRVSSQLKKKFLSEGVETVDVGVEVTEVEEDLKGGEERGEIVRRESETPVILSSYYYLFITYSFYEQFKFKIASLY